MGGPKLRIVGVVEVKSADVEVRERKSKAGTTYTEAVQWGFAQVGEETRRIRIRLGSDQPPYQPGRYEIDAALGVNEYGDLKTPYRFELKPVQSKALGVLK